MQDTNPAAGSDRPDAFPPSTTPAATPLDAALADPALPDSSLANDVGWYLRLRAFGVVGHFLGVGLAALVFHFALPAGPLAAVLGVELASVVALAAGAGKRVRGAHSLTALMTLDAVFLTLLLALTGGPYNPFSFLYLVNIALAAVILPQAHAWWLAGVSLVLSGLLFPFHLPLVAAHAAHGHHGHGAGHDMDLHMRGMWVAFAASASLIIGFVGRVRRQLEGKRAQLAAARREADRSARLASLATLAAGAAHELSTPLGTIAIAAGELDHLLRDAEPDAAEEARIIRAEVERCRRILARLAGATGATVGGMATPDTVRAIVAEAIDPLSAANRVDIRWSDGTEDALIPFPEAVTGALRNLVDNALRAADTVVHVDVRRDGDAVRIDVVDRGPGIPAERLARLGEPFYTTRPEGEGMGLGVFVTRSVAEQLGGSLDITSRSGEGTRASLVLPTGSPQ